MIISGRAAECHQSNVFRYTKFGIGVTLRIPKCSLFLPYLFSL